MTKNPASQAEETEKSLAAQAIELLFDQENVPERRRSKTVQELLGTSYHAAHRRMTGHAPWTLEDLERVAGHYGRTVADLFQALHDTQAVVGTFVAGGFRSPCRLWLGPATDPERPTPLVAWRDGEQWFVGPFADATKSSVAADAVLLQPKAQAQPRVAVLDDDAGYTRIFKSALNALGYEVDAYTRPEPLLAAARAKAYDAYVIDWLLEDRATAEGLCRALRALDASALLILQSGQLAHGDVDENGLLRTAMSLDMEPVVKPVRPSFLAAKIERHIAQRKSGDVQPVG
jgi:CheY-like chemotaxis protein